MKTYGLIFTNSDPALAPSASLAPTLTTFFQLGGTSLVAPGITKPISNLGLYTFQWSPTLPIYFLADGGTLVTDNTQRYLSGILDPLDNVNEQANTLIAFGGTNVALSILNLAQGSSILSIGNTGIALGTTNIALGTTGIAVSTAYGNSLVSIGTTLTSLSASLTANGVSVYAAALTILAQTATIAVNVSGIIVNVSLNAAAIDEINLKLGSTLSSIGSTSVDPGDIFGLLKRNQEFLEGNQTFNKSTGSWDISSRGSTLLAVKTLTNTSSQVTRS